jgi:hypothetical protein
MNRCKKWHGIGKAVMSLGILLFSLTTVCAQADVPGVWLKIGLHLEQVALPGVSGLKYGLSPGLLIGAEYQYKSKGNVTLFHSVEYSISINKSYGTSNVLTTHFGPRYVSKNNQVSLGLGGGYNLFRPSNPLYQIKDGDYVRKGSQGKWLAGATASYGHQLGRFMPYASYGFYVDTPFINSSSSILPHQLFQLGLKMAGS